MARRGCIGVYGTKTRALQRCISAEVFGLTFKDANFYLYLGSETNQVPDINDVPDNVFFEISDRAYDLTPKSVPIGMEPMSDYKADYSRFGYIDPISDEQLFRMHINDFETLGREPIIGDVFEMPFFSKSGNKAFWEVTDVDLKSEYEKFLVIIHARPLGDDRRTNEIPIDQSNDGILEDLQDEMDTTQAEQVPADTQVFDGPPAESEVDYRDDVHKDFLDDPNAEF